MNLNTKTSKIATIIKHEYLTKVRSKWFIIGTIIGPLGLLIFIAIIAFATYLSMDTTAKRIAILDYTEKLGKEIVNSDTAKYFLTQFTESELKTQVLEEKIDGFLVLKTDILKSGKATVFTKGGGGIGFISSLEKNVGNVVRHERLMNAGADVSVIKLVEEGVEISTQKVTEKGTVKDYTEAFTGIGYVMSFAIYILMFIYGGMVSRGVIEEKANRIIEVIASSARPFDILLGKVVGIGAAGLTQVFFWVLLSVILLMVAGPIGNAIIGNKAIVDAGMAAAGGGQMPMQKAFEIPYISPWLGVGFIFYFLSGYFIYATLFAAIGSAVDQESDAAQLQMPLTFAIIIPMLFISSVMANPDSTFSIVFSLIPFFSPMIMMLRVAATNVPIWQIVLSVVIMIGTFFGCLWIAAKIYRIGILMTGKKPTFKDLAKWVRMG